MLPIKIKQIEHWLGPVHTTLSNLKSAHHLFTADEKIKLLKEQQRIVRSLLKVLNKDAILIGYPRVNKN
jgi:hypothetical protein